MTCETISTVRDTTETVLSPACTEQSRIGSSICHRQRELGVTEQGDRDMILFGKKKSLTWAKTDYETHLERFAAC